MDAIWQSLWDFGYSHFYISPFWWWVFVGACVIFVSTLLSWYFTPLRPLAGAIFLAVLSGLYGYKRGERDAIEHERHRQKPKKDDDNGWWWK